MDDGMAESNIERVKRIEAVCRERGPELRRDLARRLPDDPLAKQAHAMVLRIQHLLEHDGNGSDSVGEQTDGIEPAPSLS
jgi:hypothetical protein